MPPKVKPLLPLNSPKNPAINNSTNINAIVLATGNLFCSLRKISTQIKIKTAGRCTTHLPAVCVGSALAEDSPSDSEVNQQTTGYAGVIRIALASRKIPPMLS